MALKKIHQRPDFWIGIVLSIAALVHYLQKWDISLVALAETWWPVLVIVLGVLQAFSPRYRDTGATVFLVTLGSALLVYKLELFSGEFGAEWMETFSEFLKTIFGDTGATDGNTIFSKTGDLK